MRISRHSSVPFRVLLTGAGSIARRHATNLCSLQPDAHVIAVSRHPSARFADWPKAIHSVSSLEDGLQAGCDAVMVCSDSHQHAAELLECVREGLPVFVEKPLLTDPADWARVCAAITQAHPASAIGCNLRFLPSLACLRTALQQGLVGRLVRASLDVGQWLPDWRPGRALDSSYSSSERMGGGVVFDLVHEIDAAWWLLGDLSCVASAGGQLSKLPVNAADTAVALLRTDTGIPVTVGMDYVSRQPVRRYVFVGDEGTLYWDLQACMLTLCTAGGTRELCSNPSDFSVAATYPAELAEWLEAIGQQCAPSTCALPSALPGARLMLDIVRGLT